MRAWILTYVTAEPVEAAVIAAAVLFAILAVVLAGKVGRDLDALLRDADALHEDAWLGEGGVRR